MDNKPLVSVLMPVYNAASFVEAAITSILNQTFINFEFIIFDDGSTDGSRSVIESFSDERIIFVNHNTNKGLVSSLNEGLILARGKYIARMDNDDIALPERLARQVAFLEKNLAVGVCGTALQMFGTRTMIADVPATDIEIREAMLASNPLWHPTVMMRKSVIEDYNLFYKHDFYLAEDYLMWYDFSKVSLLNNLPEVLLNYRTHEKQISTASSVAQQKMVNKIRWLQLSDKGFKLNRTDVEIYCSLLGHDFEPKTAGDLILASKVIDSILAQNQQLNAFPQEWFKRIFLSSWYSTTYKIKKFNPQYIYPLCKLYSSLHSNNINLSLVRLIVKSLIFKRRN